MSDLLAQASFEANSANFLHLTQIFGISKQKTDKFELTQPKYWPNATKLWSISAKIFINLEFRRVTWRNRRKIPN